MEQLKPQYAQILRSIKIVWWGCFGVVFIYSSTTIIMGSLPLDEELKELSEISKATLFLPALASSFVAVTLPFTIFGRTFVRKRLSSRQVVLTSAVLRLALAEVAVILGMPVFVTTGSYEMYLPFFLLSTLGLLLLKGEEKFYRDILHTLQEE